MYIGLDEIGVLEGILSTKHVVSNKAGVWFGLQ